MSNRWQQQGVQGTVKCEYTGWDERMGNGQKKIAGKGQIGGDNVKDSVNLMTYIRKWFISLYDTHRQTCWLCDLHLDLNTDAWVTWYTVDNLRAGVGLSIEPIFLDIGFGHRLTLCTINIYIYKVDRLRIRLGSIMRASFTFISSMGQTTGMPIWFRKLLYTALLLCLLMTVSLVCIYRTSAAFG